YCLRTLAGIRPRALTEMPCSWAHARTSALRYRPAAVRGGAAAGTRAGVRGPCDKRRELAAERTCVLGVQVDLVVGAVDPERQRRGVGAVVPVVDPLRYTLEVSDWNST